LKVSSSTISAVILAAIAILVIGGWSGFWFFASNQTESLVDSWIKREASVGRIWTCPDRSISGYPFTIEIACADAGFAGEAFGKQLIGSLKGFHATASLFHPDRLAALTTPPFKLRGLQNEGELELQWEVMRVGLIGQPQDFPMVSIDGTNVALRADLKGLGALSGHAGSLQSAIAPLKDRSYEAAYSIHIALADAAIPAIDSLLGGVGPDALNIQGVLTKADFGIPGPLAARVDQWRLAGGLIEIEDARLARGAMLIAGHGQLRLDEAHRPSGRLDMDFAGLDSVLKRYGIDPSLVNAGALLSSLLGGHQKPSSAPADARPALHLPVVLAHGFLSVGPVKTSIPIPALY
jgi:hypothetical protein